MSLYSSFYFLDMVTYNSHTIITSLYIHYMHMNSWHIKFGLCVMALTKNFFFGAQAKNSGIFFCKSNF